MCTSPGSLSAVPAPNGIGSSPVIPVDPDRTRSGDSFFVRAGNLENVTEEDPLQKQFPDIIQVRELVGIYEIQVKDVEVPLKIKVMRIGTVYYGIASLAVREKGAKDHVRDLSGYPSKEAALHGAANGFFSHLSPGASIKEIKNWGI